MPRGKFVTESRGPNRFRRLLAAIVTIVMVVAILRALSVHATLLAVVELVVGLAITGLLLRQRKLEVFRSNREIRRARRRGRQGLDD